MERPIRYFLGRRTRDWPILCTADTDLEEDVALVDLEIKDRSPYFDRRTFGEVGAYERIEAIAHFAVDPAAPSNQRIVDLDIAESDADGLVRFNGDVTVLFPADLAKANGAALIEVANRGRRTALRTINYATDIDAKHALDPGDGFLFERGYIVAWCGWQWDVPRSPDRVGLDAPKVPIDRVDGQMQFRVQPGSHRPDIPLTDQHVGTLGHHRVVRALDPEDPDAVMLVREQIYSPAVVVPRDKWRFAHDESGSPIPDDGHIWLDGGFEPGLIYDVMYKPAECHVVGAGLLATRDFASFLRHVGAADNPLAGAARHVIGEGQSQCGRFLRTFLHFGMNLDEAGRQVFDGLLIHIAGGRRGEFNHRFAQPSVQPTPSFGHLFPYADAPQTEPATGRAAGLLDLQRSLGGVPKIFYTDTSSEYWRGDAGLAHTELGNQGDARLPDEVRRYLFRSTQHGADTVPLSDKNAFGTRSANHYNVVDYRPLYRAALTNLLEWIRDGIDPPPSKYPRFDDGTAATRGEVLDALQAAGLELPDESALPQLRPLDLDDQAERGVGRLPARFESFGYDAPVSAVDADGNEIAGVPMPDVSVPIGTHTGFNPRHPETGGTGQILEYVGSTAPFARFADDRPPNDARSSIEERYRTRMDFLEKVRVAAESLVERRYLLATDVDLCVVLAAERYDVFMADR